MLVVVIVDDGAVLRADVVALAVERGGVHVLEEALQQRLIAGGAVVVHLYRLGVPGAPGTDGLVRRVGGLAARVADARVCDPGQPLERELEAPEAPACGEECGRSGVSSVRSKNQY